MYNIAIIPCRGGSKRLPYKNVKNLNEKPLINHTIDCVNFFKNYFSKIILTSDCPYVRNIYEKFYNSEEKIFFEKRPDFLCYDNSKVIETVKYYYEKENKNQTVDQIWLFLPTCPLRRVIDIDNAIKMLDSNYKSIISVTTYDFPPTLALEMDYNNKIQSWLSDRPWENGNSRSQDHKTLYRPNGAIYGMWGLDFQNESNFYTNNTISYYMEKEFSIDIDTEFDFKMAKNIINEK